MIEMAAVKLSDAGSSPGTGNDIKSIFVRAIYNRKETYEENRIFIVRTLVQSSSL